MSSVLSGDSGDAMKDAERCVPFLQTEENTSCDLIGTDTDTVKKSETFIDSYISN